MCRPIPGGQRDPVARIREPARHRWESQCRDGGNVPKLWRDGRVIESHYSTFRVGKHYWSRAAWNGGVDETVASLDKDSCRSI